MQNSLALKVTALSSFFLLLKFCMLLKYHTFVIIYNLFYIILHLTLLFCILDSFLFHIDGTVMIQGGKRFAAGSRPPEDEKLSLAKTMSKGASQSFGLSAPFQNQNDKDSDKNNSPRVQMALIQDRRWQRIVMNDLENIPIGLIVAWTSANIAFSPILHSVLVLVFAISRTGHTIAYAYEKQPHRAMFWMGGIASLLLMSLNGLIGALLR